jgi:hypothetical protein
MSQVVGPATGWLCARADCVITRHAARHWAVGDWLPGLHVPDVPAVLCDR